MRASATLSTLDLVRATDPELVTFARGGREGAYRELLQRYQRPVFSLVYRMVRDREQAEDLIRVPPVELLGRTTSTAEKIVEMTAIAMTPESTAESHAPSV